MVADLLRNLGIAMIGAALLLGGWKLRFRQELSNQGIGLPAGDLTIPVEIVEAGQPPRFKEIRVGR